MPQMANYIKKLENYGDLDVGIIRTTKINKVLKALIKLNTIPKDEEFNFRSRSMELLNKWNKILGSDNIEDGGSAEKDLEPAMNGVHKEEAAEKSKSTEPTPAPASESKEVKSTKTDAALPAVAEAQKSEAAAREPAPASEPEQTSMVAVDATDVTKTAE
jgi:hypothetical protein